MAFRSLTGGGVNDFLYFEKQSAGRFCGVHCLNNALQKHEFSRETLQRIGNHFGSDHASADGFFSVEVLALGLQSVGLDMVPLTHPSLASLSQRMSTLKDCVLIANNAEHWLAMRDIKGRYFAVDSIRGPMAIANSDIDNAIGAMKDWSKGWAMFAILPQNYNPSDVVKAATGVRERYAPMASPQSVIKRLSDFGEYGVISFDVAQQIADSKGGSSSLPGGGGSSLGGSRPQDGSVSNNQQPAAQLFQGKGYSLGGGVSSSSGVVGVNDNEDPELAAAIKASLQSLREELPSPKAPVPVNGSSGPSVRLVYNRTKSDRSFGGCTMTDFALWALKEFDGGSLAVMSNVSLSTIEKKLHIARVGRQITVFDGGSDVTRSMVVDVLPDMEMVRVVKAE